MTISLWVTTKCNLECLYCYEKDGTKNNKLFIDDKLQENIISSLKTQEKIDEIIFHGGEPLINFSFIRDVVDEIKKINPSVRFSFTTNGTIFDNEIREFLIRNKENFFHGISISIDGTKDNHNVNRKYLNGKGSYNEVQGTSKELLKIFPDLRARMTVSPNTVKHLYDNITHIHKLGFNTIAVAFDYFNKKWENKHLEIITREYRKIIEYWHRNKSAKISLVYELRSKRKLNRCKLEYHIYSDGSIYPCTYVTGNKNFVIGNVMEGIDKIAFNKILSLNTKDNEFCAECNNKIYCIHNRCKLMNMSINVDCYMPSEIGCALENIKLKMAREYAGILETDIID